MNAAAYGPRAMSCEVCHRVFSTQQALAQHYASMHDERLGNVKNPRRRVRRRQRSNMPRQLTGGYPMIPSGTNPLYPQNAAMLSNTGRGMGLSLAGEEYAVRAISPCDERFEEGRQIPDMATAESAVITGRIITAITGPSGTGQLWNLLAVTIPVPEIAFIYKTWQPTDTSDISNLPWIVVKHRTVVPGAVQIPGVSVGGTQFAYQPTGGKGTLLTEAEQFRQSAKGLTFNLNASALNNQGMVLAAQYGEKLAYVSDYEYVWDNAIVPPSGFVVGNLSPIAPLNVGPVYVLDEVPSTTDQIFQKDPHAVRQNAKLGAYVPLKFNDPVSQFSPVNISALKAVSPTTAAPTDPIDSLVPVVIQTPAFASTLQSKQWLKHPDFASTADFVPVVATAGPTNMQCSIVYFEGLSLSASIDVKTVAALEVVATGDSSWAGFMRDSPEEDEMVQKQVHAIQRRLPSAFPSSYNFLGTLLTKVAPMLGSFAVSLLGHLYNKFVDKSAKYASIG